MAGMVTVSHSDYGEAWPLTVESGALFREGTAVIFRAPDGTEYAVNGMALTHGYPRIDPIWADNSTADGPKVDIGPLIEVGLAIDTGEA